ncbi:hypothetical protein ACT3TQ_13230 [Halomonas sp. AOP12-C2-37]|uniref:hypothetical protein n=1 Tax=unclassified Halomonas TaxID=2609666 RepID=UPI004033B63A
MDINTSIQLSDGEKSELATILDCDVDLLEQELQPIASAAMLEYTAMILGQKVFKRGSDMLEYRLFLLIQHRFGNKIPDEQKVCRLFQCTSSESRSLIRSVMSKYQYVLKDAIEDSVKDAVNEADRADGETKYSVVINSKTVVDELNRKLAELDGTLPSVKKKSGSVSTYEIAPSAYENLKFHFGL